MYILGIETSTQICGVSLVKNETWIAEYHLNQKNVHAAKVTHLIDAVLKQAGIEVSQLGGIAVSIGPGSFTGLRIGLSVAKGLALGGHVPLVAVPTFDALAGQAPLCTGVVCPVLKSRSYEYFYGIYERTNFSTKMRQPPQLVLTKDIADALPKDALVIGHIEELRQDNALNERYTFAPPALAKPSALSVAQLGREKLQAGDTATFETLEPMYFQDFVAGKPKPR